MLKTALIIMAICAVLLIVYLITQSIKLLRKAEKQQLLEKSQQPKQYQLHPKLKKQDQSKDQH